MRINILLTICTIIFLLILLPSSKNLHGEVKETIKCLLQMKNYSGEGAYIVISLLDRENKYIETLYVHGDDPEWYHEISSWWKFYGKKRNNIDAISGETLAGGERGVNIISFDKSKLKDDYKIRFETAVEDKNYYEKDIEISLSDIDYEKKYIGNGFLRYVRLIKD